MTLWWEMICYSNTIKVQCWEISTVIVLLFFFQGLVVTTVWLVPAVVLITAAVFHLYRLMLRHLAKTTVRNKVVLITDSLSALGNGTAAAGFSATVSALQYRSYTLDLLCLRRFFFIKGLTKFQKFLSIYLYNIILFRCLKVSIWVQ